MENTKHGKFTTDAVLSEIRGCLDAAVRQPGLVRASVYQTEGYLRGLQGLPWELPAEPRPTPQDAAASFLHDVREGTVAIRGRIKIGTEECLEFFLKGLAVSFPESEKMAFASPIARVWVRWLGNLAYTGRPSSFSFETGRDLGVILKKEYEEGLAGNLAEFLLDKRLHLIRVPHFLRMRGWLLGTIERLRRDEAPQNRERAHILNANLSSIVLRSLHNAGPNYAAEAVSKLEGMTSDLDQAIANLSSVEPEAAGYLRNNRSTIITRALHSGVLNYGRHASEILPSALKNFDRRVVRIESSSPEKAKLLRSNKRSIVYRALTNGRLDRLR